MENKPNLAGVLVGLVLAFLGAGLSQIWSVYERNRDTRRAIFELTTEINMNSKILQSERTGVRAGVADPLVTRGSRIGTQLGSAAFERNWTHLADEDAHLSQVIVGYYAELRQVSQRELEWTGMNENLETELSRVETLIEKGYQQREFLIANQDHIKNLSDLIKENGDQMGDLAEFKEKLQRTTPELQKDMSKELRIEIDVALSAGVSATAAMKGMTAELKFRDSLLSCGIMASLVAVAYIFLHISYPDKKKRPDNEQA
jgi:hypothetical protein